MVSRSFTVVFSEKAEKEILLTWEWYEEKQQGLGDRFFSELKKKISSLQQNPELFPKKTKTYREVAMSVFPFLIIYRIEKWKQEVRILSLFHTSRNPKKKYR